MCAGQAERGGASYVMCLSTVFLSGLEKQMDVYVRERGGFPLWLILCACGHLSCQLFTRCIVHRELFRCRSLLRGGLSYDAQVALFSGVVGLALVQSR